QNSISALRKVLGPGLLLTKPPGYVLAVDADQIDLRRFERLVRDAAGHDAAERAVILRRALDLWRGEPLAELAFEPFAGAEVRRLEELRLVAAEDWVDAELEAGRQAELVPELEALVARHPLRERLRGQLMLALYRSGRQADALAAYQDIRRLLSGELGLEPGPQLPPLLRERGKPHMLLVTSGYDLALEEALLEAGEEFDVVSYVASGRDRGRFRHVLPDGTTRLIDMPNTYATELSLERRTIVLKLHGGVDASQTRERESFVVTEDDYIDYLAYGEAAAIPVALAAKLRRSHFLFLGYGVRDWNLRL